MKTGLWIMKKLIFGFVALFSFNLVGTLIGVVISPTCLSALLVGSLGFPGAVLVYIGKFLLGIIAS